LTQSPDEGGSGSAKDAGAARAAGGAPVPACGERALRREDFCEEWIQEITARAARLGD
jgi:hypothetical protein